MLRWPARARPPRRSISSKAVHDEEVLKELNVSLVEVSVLLVASWDSLIGHHHRNSAMPFSSIIFSLYPISPTDSDSDPFSDLGGA
jgi:hypothetical protein